MTLIQHTRTYTNMHTLPTLACSHNHFFLLSALCNAVCGYRDPSNLISQCGRVAYIRSSRAGHTEEKKKKRMLKKDSKIGTGDDNDDGAGDEFRMTWSLYNSQRWIYAGMERNKWKALMMGGNDQQSWTVGDCFRVAPSGETLTLHCASLAHRSLWNSLQPLNLMLAASRLLQTRQSCQHI